jgi:hypothetical protein
MAPCNRSLSTESSLQPTDPSAASTTTSYRQSDGLQIYFNDETGWLSCDVIDVQSHLDGSKVVQRIRVRWEDNSAQWITPSDGTWQIRREMAAGGSEGGSSSSMLFAGGVETARGGFTRLELKCQVSFTALEEPAKGTLCRHLACVNMKALQGVASRRKSCPLLMCSAELTRRGCARDEWLQAKIAGLPKGTSEVWVDREAQILLTEPPDGVRGLSVPALEVENFVDVEEEAEDATRHSSGERDPTRREAVVDITSSPELAPARLSSNAGGKRKRGSSTSSDKGGGGGSRGDGSGSGNGIGDGIGDGRGTRTPAGILRGANANDAIEIDSDSEDVKELPPPPLPSSRGDVRIKLSQKPTMGAHLTLKLSNGLFQRFQASSGRLYRVSLDLQSCKDSAAQGQVAPQVVHVFGADGAFLAFEQLPIF